MTTLAPPAPDAALSEERSDQHTPPPHCSGPGAPRRAHTSQGRALCEEMVGKRYGTRIVVAYAGCARTRHGKERTIHQVLVRCDCGDERVLAANFMKQTRACHLCSLQQRAGANAIEALLSEAGRRAPAVWRGNEPACVEAVCDLIDVIGRPLTYSEIGALLGVTRQRAQQIEAQATQRIRSSRLARQLAAEVEERDGGSWDAWSRAAEAAAGGGAW